MEMKRPMYDVIGMGVAFSLLLPILPSEAAPTFLETKFANCAELVKIYPGGVAKSKSAKNKGGKTVKTPTVNAKIYAANKSKDRDGDGIACER